MSDAKPKAKPRSCGIHCGGYEPGGPVPCRICRAAPTLRAEDDPPACCPGSESDRHKMSCAARKDRVTLAVRAEDDPRRTVYGVPAPKVDE